jgi:hypothetical protein
MSEASRRTIAWREQKREEGYQPVTIWIPAGVKNQMVNVAFERHQDLGQLLCEAFQAWSGAKGTAGRAPDVRQLAARVRALESALASRPPASTTGEAQAAQRIQEDPLPPAAPGRKWCLKRLHQYPVGKKECPQCANTRKQASRRRQAAARRDAGLT